MEMLWVGNIPPDTTIVELMALFANYGALDCITVHGARNFAFVLFHNVNDAREARGALQSTKIRGKFINIEFSRLARPCEQLWTGGIGPSVTDEQLKAEFAKFGCIKYFNFYRNRNSALINFVHVRDAITAQRYLNGKHISDNRIRVAFLMAKPSRKVFFNRNSSINQCISSSEMRGRLASEYQQRTVMHKEHQSHRLQSDDQPSNVLWVGYPPYLPIDEQKLFNTMILSGEIQTIKRVPSCHGCYVEFRSIDEACRTKERFEGRLLGEPTIQILFVNNASTTNIDRAPVHPVQSMSKRHLDGQGSFHHYGAPAYHGCGGASDDTLVDQSSMSQKRPRDDDVFPPTEQGGFPTIRMGYEDFGGLHVGAYPTENVSETAVAQNIALEDRQNCSTQGNNLMVQTAYDQRAQLQTNPSSSSARDSSESDAEKCNRYESLLQFAADILVQIYQRQQQLAKSQNAHGKQ